MIATQDRTCRDDRWQCMREGISGMQTSPAQRIAMRRRASNYRHCSREPSSPINTQGERERETGRHRDRREQTSPDISGNMVHISASPRHFMASPRHHFRHCNIAFCGHDIWGDCKGIYLGSTLSPSRHSASPRIATFAQPPQHPTFV